MDSIAKKHPIQIRIWNKTLEIYNIKIVGHKYDGILRGYRVIGPAAILDNRKILDINVN